MGYEWAHSGTVSLKDGVGLHDVLNLYPCEDDQSRLPLQSSGEVSLQGGRVWLQVTPGRLCYAASGDGGQLDEEVTSFLEAVAEEFAAAGWMDEELEGVEVAFGRTELMRAEAKARSARVALAAANAELEAAEMSVRRLGQERATR